MEWFETNDTYNYELQSRLWRVRAICKDINYGLWLEIKKLTSSIFEYFLHEDTKEHVLEQYDNIPIYFRNLIIFNTSHYDYEDVKEIIYRGNNDNILTLIHTSTENKLIWAGNEFGDYDNGEQFGIIAISPEMEKLSYNEQKSFIGLAEDYVDYAKTLIGQYPDLDVIIITF